jgi:hypothetical protein
MKQGAIMRAAGMAGFLLLSAMPLPGTAGDGQPIRFAPGASSAEVSGTVLRGEVARYTLNARQGQTMHLGITALEDNAVFQLYPPGSGAAALPGAAEGEDATRWSGRLPRSGDYRIVVGATRGNASYRLSIRID